MRIPTYTFRGYNAQGRRVGGGLRYDTRARVEAAVSQMGITDYEIFESQTRYSTEPYTFTSPGELALFCHEMGSLLSSDMTLMEGLAMLSAQTGNEQLKLALAEIYRHVSKGFTLGGAMCMYDHVFGVYLLHMINAGESMGALGSVFDQMADFFEQEDRAQKQSSSILIYPSIRLALLWGAAFLLLSQMVPVFERLLTVLNGDGYGELGFFFQAALFLGRHSMIVVALWLVMAALLYLAVNIPIGRRWLDQALITLPLLRNVYLNLCTARLARGLFGMFKYGLMPQTMPECIPTVLGNRYMEQKICIVFGQLESGRELPVILESAKNFAPAFPSLFRQMLLVGYNTGQLDTMMERAAAVFTQETDVAIAKATAAIEPLLLAGMSFAVGLPLFAMIFPLVNAMGAIGR